MNQQQLEVKVGQVWQDWDVRFRDDQSPRLLTIKEIEGAHAIAQSSRGRKVRILLRRFKEDANGYKLVKDANA